jgi:hypothetical protein
MKKFTAKHYIFSFVIALLTMNHLSAAFTIEEDVVLLEDCVRDLGNDLVPLYGKIQLIENTAKMLNAHSKNKNEKTKLSWKLKKRLIKTLKDLDDNINTFLLPDEIDENIKSLVNSSIVLNLETLINAVNAMSETFANIYFWDYIWDHIDAIQTSIKTVRNCIQGYMPSVPKAMASLCAIDGEQMDKIDDEPPMINESGIEKESPILLEKSSESDSPSDFLG